MSDSLTAFQMSIRAVDFSEFLPCNSRGLTFFTHILNIAATLALLSCSYGLFVRVMLLFLNGQTK